MTQPIVTDNPEAKRFEAHIDGRLAGFDRLLAGGTRKALPVCPFIKGWIQRHPEYLPITYGAPPSRAD